MSTTIVHLQHRRDGVSQPWSSTKQDQAATARTGLAAKFLREADGDPQRAASLRTAYFTRIQEVRAIYHNG
jgi:hypothetical protein